jgi:cystathionine beta-lyase/cystathionine gamma-synthase
MKNTTHRLDTKLIHSGEPQPRIEGAVIMPIFQSAMFEYADETDYHNLKYIRLNNTPNHEALHRKLASLENAEAAVVTASGMAAISTTLLALLSAGDHLLIQDCLYGGTHNFVTKDLGAFGVAYDFVGTTIETADESNLCRDDEQSAATSPGSGGRR